MEKDFIIVYESEQVHLAEIARTILEDNELECIVLNKRDSSYPTFGTIEVYVHETKAEEAKLLLAGLDE